MGNSHKGRQASVHKGKYNAQRIRTTANKARSRQRHLDNNPNDLQAKKAIEKLKEKSDGKSKESNSNK